MDVKSEVPGGTPQRRYGMLVKSDIEALRLIDLPKGVVADPSCSKSASYDLRIGYEYLMPSQNHSSDAIKQKMSEGEALIIPPYGARIVSTREHVRPPDNVAGKFNIRIKYALRGLIAQMGTQVEPDYHGPLFALLQNITDKEVRIPTQGDGNRIFTIEFYFLADSVTPKSGETKAYSGIESIHDDVRFHGTLNSITQRLQDDTRRLSEELALHDKQIRQEITAAGEKRSALYSVLVSIGVAAMLGVIGPFVINWTFKWPVNDPLFKCPSERSASHLSHLSQGA